MKRLSPAQGKRLRQIAAHNNYYRSPFTATDYSLEARGLMVLEVASHRSPGPAYYTTSYYRTLTAAGETAAAESLRMAVIDLKKKADSTRTAT